MISWFFREIYNSLKRTPASSVINILGMSFGVAIFMLIMLYVRSELRVNRDFEHYDNIYRISQGDGTAWQGIPPRIGELLQKDMPEVISFVRIDPGGSNHVFKIDDVPMRTGRLTYVDSVFFKIFDLPFKYGNSDNCLNSKYDMVITESLSEKLFGAESPIGKSVRLDNKFDARITGVIYDPGQKTHINSDVFISFHSMPDMKNWPDLYDCWTCYNYQTYLLVIDNIDPLELTKKINTVLDNHGKILSEQSLIDDEYSLTDMHDVYFGKEERPEFRKGNYLQLRLLTSIGVLILVIAIINYINLATAQASSRIRQLALRRVMGASRRILIYLILGEAVLISVISVNIAIAILELIRPLFNSIMGLDLSIGYFSNAYILPAFVLGGVIIGLISGLYPAMSITRFGTAGSLHNEIRESSSGGRVRRILTIFQVFISIALIASALIIYSQLRYINNADLGFDKEILVYLPLNKEIRERHNVFRSELIKHQGIENVSYSYASYRTSNERWGFDFKDINVSLHMEGVDEYYLKTIGLELIEGRDFYGEQDEGKLIINEEAQRKYFGEDAIGTRVEALSETTEIIGIVKDFRFQTFDTEVEPIGLIYRPGWRAICNLRLKGSDFNSTIKYVEDTWSQFCLEYPFEYHFVDQLYESRYRKYKSVGDLLVFFSVISVLIASLGIFGLASFSVAKRIKEVGIRKVNGSSISEIVALLSSDINKILLWSLIPSFIASYMVMSRWLTGFAYHISMPFWVFPLAAIIVWLVALLSTVGKTIRAAKINPAEILRSE